MLFAVFVAEAQDGALAGFVEAGLPIACRWLRPRCPAGFREGWFVAEDFRAKGMGARPLAAAGNGARSCGCAEIPGSITLSPSTPTKRFGLRWSIAASTAANQWPTKSVSIDPPPSEIAYNRVILTLTR